MSEELFKKIISELSHINYSGYLSLFSNNEPFLDERIINFAKYARENLKNAELSIWTNGTLLTFEKFQEIIKYLDMLVIDNYNDDKKINSPELEKIYNYLQEHPDLKREKLNSAGKVYFNFRLQNQILTSRGGQAPNKSDKKLLNKKVLKEICRLPFSQLIIRPDGKISLCCNDPLGKYTLGDLNKQSIKEIWNSDEYKKIRLEMLKHGRKNLNLCNSCDNATLEFYGIK